MKGPRHSPRSFHLSWGKILPATIFLATAWQLLSDRIHLPGVPISWASGGNSDVAAAYAAPPTPHVDKAEDMAEGYAAVKLPFGLSPVVSSLFQLTCLLWWGAVVGRCAGGCYAAVACLEM